RRGLCDRSPRRNVSRPACDQGHAHAALEGRALALAEGPGAPAVLASLRDGPVGGPQEPWSVVARENDERLVVDAQLTDLAQQLADARVELGDDVSIEAAGRAAEELVRCI